MSEQKISAIVEMSLQIAADIAKDDEAAERGVETTLEQRICVAMIQARALEARTQAGFLLIKQVGAGEPAAARMAQLISVALRDRSTKLEQIAMDLAKNWPPQPLSFDPLVVQ